MNEASTVVALPVLTFYTLGLSSMAHIFQMSYYYSHCLQNVLRSGTAKLGGVQSPKPAPFLVPVASLGVPKTTLRINNSLEAHRTHWKLFHTHGCVLLQLRIQTKINQEEHTGRGPGKFQMLSLQLSIS